MQERARSGGEAAQRSEPRALRTRHLVVAAFLRLLDERPYAELTVAELCREAGVHRVTFYGHWPDLDALAGDVFAELIDAIAAVPTGPTDADLAPGAITAEYVDAMRGILLEIAGRRDAYRTLLTSPAGGLSRRLVDIVAARVELAVARLAERGVAVRGGVDYAAAFIAGGVVASMTRWAAMEGDVDGAVASIVAQMPGWWPDPDPHD